MYIVQKINYGNPYHSDHTETMWSAAEIGFHLDWRSLVKAHPNIYDSVNKNYQIENQPDKLKLEDELRNEVVSSSGDGLAITSLYSLERVTDCNFHNNNSRIAL